MKGRFKSELFQKDEKIFSSDWISNRIHEDFSRLLAQILHDLMGKADKVSRLANHGFYMAVGPGGARENPQESFKKEIENMEKLASSPQKEGARLERDVFRGKKETLYTVENRRYYAIQLEARDIQLRTNEIVIEATLAEKNPRTNGLKVREFGLFTKYPSSSENIYLLNYGQHSEIRKDDDLTLSRKIEFIF